jgi:hypothetical protein
MLDLVQANPQSKLPASPFSSLHNLRIHTAAMLLRMVPYRFEHPLRKCVIMLDSDPPKAL